MPIFEISCHAGAFEYLVYSLRHFYAVNALRNGVGVFDVARNTGTSGSKMILRNTMASRPLLLYCDPLGDESMGWAFE